MSFAPDPSFKNFLRNDITTYVFFTGVNAYRKPTFKVPLVDQKIPKKAETVHKVVIIADPTPDIVWLHNGKEVSI